MSETPVPTAARTASSSPGRAVPATSSCSSGTGGTEAAGRAGADDLTGREPDRCDDDERRAVAGRSPGGRRVVAGASVHFGRADAIRAARAKTLTGAYSVHPERFVRKPPEPPALPGAVWINKPESTEPTNSTNP